MAFLPSIECSGKERLQLLRRLDRVHAWSGLRDQRYCTHCHAVFDGREIEIVGGTRASGPLRLQCPAPSCIGAPKSWLRAVEGKAVPDGPEGEAVVLSHSGHICTFRRPNRGARVPAACQKQPQDYWAGLRRAGSSLLHLLPASLQHGRVVFQQLRSRAG